MLNLFSVRAHIHAAARDKRHMERGRPRPRVAAITSRGEGAPAPGRSAYKRTASMHKPAASIYKPGVSGGKSVQMYTPGASGDARSCFDIRNLALPFEGREARSAGWGARSMLGRKTRSAPIRVFAPLPRAHPTRHSLRECHPPLRGEGGQERVTRRKGDTERVTRTSLNPTGKRARSFFQITRCVVHVAPPIREQPPPPCSAPRPHAADRRRRQTLAA